MNIVEYRLDSGPVEVLDRLDSVTTTLHFEKRLVVTANIATTGFERHVELTSLVNGGGVFNFIKCYLGNSDPRIKRYGYMPEICEL